MRVSGAHERECESRVHEGLFLPSTDCYSSFLPLPSLHPHLMECKLLRPAGLLRPLADHLRSTGLPDHMREQHAALLGPGDGEAQRGEQLALLVGGEHLRAGEGVRGRAFQRERTKSGRWLGRRARQSKMRKGGSDRGGSVEHSGSAGGGEGMRQGEGPCGCGARGSLTLTLRSSSPTSLHPLAKKGTLHSGRSHHASMEIGSRMSCHSASRGR